MKVLSESESRFSESSEKIAKLTSRLNYFAEDKKFLTSMLS